jgi:hypothetical protein
MALDTHPALAKKQILPLFFSFGGSSQQSLKVLPQTH